MTRSDNRIFLDLGLGETAASALEGVRAFSVAEIAPSAPAAHPKSVASDVPANPNDAIAIDFVREALEELCRRGYDVDRMLTEASIPTELLADPRATVSPSQFARLWRLTVSETGDELFLLDPRGMPAGSYGLMCHAVLHSADLERALRRALRMFGILLSGLEFRIERNGDTTDVVFLEKGPPRPAVAYCAIIVLVFGLVCWLVDERIPLSGLQFRSPPPLNPDRYRRLLHEELRFDSPVTKVSFDSSKLKLRPNRTEEQMRRFLRDVPEVLLVRYRSRDSLSAEIRRRLRQTQPEAWPSFHALAASFLMTSSTLRRRLEDEGNSYQQIKDDVRRERAIRHLRSGTKTNSDIAAELGFCDPSTFYRAFKKWTGKRPADFRPSADRSVAGEASIPPSWETARPITAPTSSKSG